MKKFKGVYVPEITDEIRMIQIGFCGSAGECVKEDDCVTCIYDEKNLKLFKEWFKTQQQ